MGVCVDFDFLGYLANLFGPKLDKKNVDENEALIQQHKKQQEEESKERFWRQFNPVLRSREGDDSWTDDSKSWIQEAPKTQEVPKKVDEEEFKNIKSLVN